MPFGVIACLVFFYPVWRSIHITCLLLYLIVFDINSVNLINIIAEVIYLSVFNITKREAPNIMVTLKVQLASIYFKNIDYNNSFAGSI